MKKKKSKKNPPRKVTNSFHKKNFSAKASVMKQKRRRRKAKKKMDNEVADRQITTKIMDKQEWKIGELVLLKVDNERELPLAVKDDSNQYKKE